MVNVSKFKTEEEGIALANDTTYGLAAAIHSNDHKQVTRVSGALQAGTVWCNQYALLHAGVPFGGFKMSGIGRELGTYGLEAYTQVRHFVIRRVKRCDRSRLGSRRSSARGDEFRSLGLMKRNTK